MKTSTYRNTARIAKASPSAFNLSPLCYEASAWPTRELKRMGHGCPDIEMTKDAARRSTRLYCLVCTSEERGRSLPAAGPFSVFASMRLPTWTFDPFSVNEACRPSPLFLAAYLFRAMASRPNNS